MSKNNTPLSKIPIRMISNRKRALILFMKKLMIITLLTIAPSVFAKESITLSPINFQINAVDALSKVEQTVLYPEGLLKRFQPVGAKISNKKVSQNVISFVATKSVLFISKSVYVNGILDSVEDSKSCLKDGVGYKIKMSFDASDDLVTNNVEELQATICLYPQSDSKLVGNVQSKIVTGNNYSKVLGPTAVNLIKEQVSPLLNALTEEIKSLK